MHRKAYDRFLSSGTPISKIKDSALRGRLFSDAPVGEYRSGADEGGGPQNAGVVGRSIAWKVSAERTSEPTYTKTLSM